MGAEKENAGRLILTSGKIGIGKNWFGSVVMFYFGGLFFLEAMDSVLLRGDYSEIHLLIPLILFFFVVALFLAMNVIVGFRTIVLSKEGCEILWWKYRKFWTWEEMKHRCWVKYTGYINRYCPQHGYGVVWLCTKPVDIAYLMDAPGMTVFAPMSRVGIHFLPQGYKGDMENHSFSFAVDKDTFMNFIKAIGLKIEDIDLAKCIGE